MGAAGRTRVLAEFSIRRMVDQTTSLYHQIAGEHDLERGTARQLQVNTRHVS
jgi:hypothetical protein